MDMAIIAAFVITLAVAGAALTHPLLKAEKQY
jgi:hypothetical protein